MDSLPVIVEGANNFYAGCGLREVSLGVVHEMVLNPCHSSGNFLRLVEEHFMHGCFNYL